jgi:hypothetical protein
MMISAKIDTLLLIQFILYHLLWVLSAYLIPRQKNRVLYSACLVIIVLQVIVVTIDLPKPISFAISVMVLSAVGIGIDTIFTRLGWFRFNPTPSYIIPLWLCFIWLSFALSMQYLILFFPGKFYVWAILGAIGFPLSYYVAQKLKVFSVPRPWSAYGFQGLFWLIFLPIILLINH